MIGGLPTMLSGRAAILELARVWARTTLWLLDKICGDEGRVPRPRKSPAARLHHRRQAPVDLGDLRADAQVHDFTYILKRELIFLPLFGQYLTGSDQIAIDRNSRSAAMKRLVEQAGDSHRRGTRDLHLSRGHAPPGRRAARL